MHACNCFMFSPLPCNHNYCIVSFVIIIAQNDTAVIQAVCEQRIRM